VSSLFGWAYMLAGTIEDPQVENVLALLLTIYLQVYFVFIVWRWFGFVKRMAVVTAFESEHTIDPPMNPAANIEMV